MMSILYKSIILLFTLSSCLYAEIINKVELEGNSRINVETIKVYGDITLDKDYSAIEVNDILKNLYATDFFEDIKINLNNGILKVIVKEYAIINDIKLKGEKSTRIKEAILKRLTLKVKGSYIESKLIDDVNLVKKAYASLGYNFAEVNTKVLKFESGRINLSYLVDKGKKTSISKISFIGDKKIKEKRLRDVIASEEDKFWKIFSKNTNLSASNIKLDKRLLINYYKSLGYYDVQVLSNNAELSANELTNLTYTINAGTRYKINKISTNVSDVLDKKKFLLLENSFTKLIGKYYSPFKVKKLLDDLDNLIADNDLQFIEHSVNEILDGDVLEIKINIYEGKKAIVERVNIKGNTITDESVIRAELLLDEGDPFNVLKLDKSIAKLQSRNIFSEVKKKVINGSEKDQKIIELLVEEKPTGEISAGAGIGTNGGSIAFSVKENNWLGRGIAVSTNLDLTAEKFGGGISVKDPNYNYSGNSINYFIQNTQTDKTSAGYKNNVISAGVGTGFEQYKNIYLSPQIVYSLDNLKVQSSASAALKKQKGTFSDLSFNYGIAYDARDRAFAPTDGYFSNFNQSLPIYADASSIQNSYSFSMYESFSKNLLGSFKFYGAAINGLSDDVRLSKRLKLSNTMLRGFKSGKLGPQDGTDFVGGNYAVASNFELALPNLLPESTKTDIGLFLDVGNLWGIDYDQTISNSNDLRSSYGINTSWTSPVGPMVFTFARTLAKATTDITEGFNFRLGTTF
jgi:outer membrane protein insertion porin family